MPRIVLIGDSVRIGYQPAVRRHLGGGFDLWGPEGTGWTSADVRRNLPEWMARGPADLVHLNCGLHDLRRPPEGGWAVPPETYRENLAAVLETILARWTPRLIWATTTPVHDARHARRALPYDRFVADVERYNAASVEVADRFSLPVNDLYGAVIGAGAARLLGPDGTHFTPEGRDLLGRAVAEAVRRALA